MAKFTTSEANYAVDLLNLNKELVDKLMDLQPAETLVICGFLAGTLSAQLPAATEALVESTSFFKELWQRSDSELVKLKKQEISDENVIVWIWPELEKKESITT